MKKGPITKVLFKGRKVYAVIAEFGETNVTVRFPICGVSGQVEIAEQTLPAADYRKPMLRQDTGVHRRYIEMFTEPRRSPRFTS